MEQSQLLTTAEAATYMRLKPQTLAKWRSHGKGPDFVRMGGNVYYRLTELDQYIEAGITTPEAK
jgi:excisionase family DNA binding protein